jgi:cyclopropane-fatty-acyl-phospholipid synthase
VNKFDKQIEQVLATSGIKINGPQVWDIRVNDERFYKRVMSTGSLGLGESYMDKWWEVDALDEMFFKLLSVDRSRTVKFKHKLPIYLKSKFLNLQNKRRSFISGKFHYETGLELFKHMLDKRLTYTCGYWKKAATLDQAQEDKLDLVCRKIGLKKGQRVLDIGCGWGSFIKFAAEQYGAQTVGITVSKQQAEYAKQDCIDLPVEVRLQDYRELNEKFDHIVSLGMFEHVGVKNHKSYMEVVSRCLNEDGLFLLHTIGSNNTRHQPDPWFHKYIFPNGMLPSMNDIQSASNDKFIMEDCHSMGEHYDKTLMAWFENFDTGWEQINEQYGDRFYRMWKYYLLCSAGAFRASNLQLWQFVFSKNGIVDGYEAIR